MTGKRETKTMNRARDFDGSASVEFIIFGLPLLISSMVFFAMMHRSGIDSAQGNALAREAVHAFVDSKSDDEGYLRVAQIIERFENIRSNTLNGRLSEAATQPGELIETPVSISFTIRCASRPCISPANRVQISLHTRSDNGDQRTIGRAQSSVSRWVS